ncbi:trypsin-like peptidase domain-containing protein [Streptomyces fagopyri]|uniref:S1C family serine protease n=1 Tax=Streptomyces fagopyri TaxID=2662397 RepID=UPI0036973E12
MNEPKPTKAKWWSRPRPVPPVVAEAGSAEDAGLSEGGFGPEGDFEPERDSGHDGDFVLERPLPVLPAADARPAAVSDAAPASAAPVDRPGPLHDPDPYSTPPYGEPGPWAPAPPVQHPALTSAPGPSVPAPTPVHDPAAPTGAGVPARETPTSTPTPVPVTPAQGVPASPVGPAQGVPAQPVAPAQGTPALTYGTSAPPDTSAHGTPAPAEDSAYEIPASVAGSAYGTPAAAVGSAYERPAPVPDTAYGTPTPAPGTVYETSAPAGAAPYETQAPLLGAAYGTSASESGAPDPSGGTSHGASAPVAVSGAGTGVPAGTPTPGASLPPGAPPAPYTSTSRPAPDPWQNYDPWATPGPLQQNGAAAGTGTRRQGRTTRSLVLGAVLITVVAGGVGGAVGVHLERDGESGDIVLHQAAEEAPGRPADSVAGIAARALPGVVTLHVRGADKAGTGTGFVLDTRGHILTNNHVVEPAGARGEITVTFSGGESAKATVVGHDSGYDLAVVEVTRVAGLRPLPLGNSDSVQVGDPVVAIGAPFDLANTVTSGIISAKERPITAGGEKGDGSDVSYVDALQTDASINPGNSGGPLLDSRARVIGINSAIRSADGAIDPQAGQAGSIGLGFAIPVNQARRVAEELINTGRATHPVIGVTLDLGYTGDGARVGTKTSGGSPVTPGGPGARAGIRAGDVITEVDGLRVHSGEELIVRTRAHRPGDRLLLTLRRDGTREKITLVLGSADGD